MTKDEAIDNAFLAHDATFNYQSGKIAFLRALEENGLYIVPINPTTEMLNSAYKAGGVTVSATFRIWRAFLSGAKNATELVDAPFDIP